MTFYSERMRLAEQYETWRSENNVKDCPMSVISYLEGIGRLKYEPDNLPLTEEQIRARVGQPVFVDYNLTGTKEWAIIKSVSDMKIWFSDGMYIWLNDIDKTVDIYAHEPKKDGAE